jgi:P-type Mg2+ transporter
VAMIENRRTIAILPFTKAGAFMGFTPPPAAFFGILAVMIAAYLLLIELGKGYFFGRIVRAATQASRHEGAQSPLER